MALAAALGRKDEAMFSLVWRVEGPPFVFVTALYRAALAARPFLLFAMVKTAWGLRWVGSCLRRISVPEGQRKFLSSCAKTRMNVEALMDDDKKGKVTKVTPARMGLQSAGQGWMRVDVMVGSSGSCTYYY